MSRFNAYEHLKISLNSDGTLQRPTVKREPANPNPAQWDAVASKDITINTDKNLWVRVYRPSKLPSNDGCIARLPIIIFFPSGCFINHNVADILYQNKCTQLSKEVLSIVVSVNYRQAPEYRLPSQYDDAMDAILWVRKQALDKNNGEQWLRDYGDFSRCYLLGRANGANTAYNVALKTLDHADLNPLRIGGIILNQPMFGGKQRTKSELKYACDEVMPLPCWDLAWELALPKGTDRDHRYCNPMMDAAAQQSKLKKLGRCLVMGYGMDPMVDRQQEFVTMLVGCGAKVEAHFDDVGFHGVDIVDPKRAKYNLQLIREFVN